MTDHQKLAFCPWTEPGNGEPQSNAMEILGGKQSESWESQLTGERGVRGRIANLGRDGIGSTGSFSLVRTSEAKDQN